MNDSPVFGSAQTSLLIPLGFVAAGSAGHSAWAQTPRAGIGVPGIALPLHGIETDCTDPRYPSLAGAWVVWCTHDDVDRVSSLISGEDFELPLSHRSPGVGENLIYIPGREGGLIELRDDGPVLIEDITRIHHRLVAPPDVSDGWIAVLTTDTLQAFPATKRSRRTFATQPAEWYPPALSPPWVAWVEDGGASGEDIYWLNTETDHQKQLLSGGDGHQRHIVASGAFFAWVESDALVIMDSRDQSRERIAARTGFSAPPALWNDLACWEDRSQQDLDIVCSDGLEIRRPGHQQRPSLFSDWLIFTEEETLFLYRLESSAVPGQDHSR